MKIIKSVVALLLLASLFLSACSASLSLPETEKEEAPKTTEEEKTEVTEKETLTEEETGKDIMQEYDPAEDEVMNILMIGNSFCYYYVEELYGIAKAAGVDMKVCNVYYSGCKLKQHWTWWKQNESNYQYFETDEKGRKKYENYSLKMCLARENWDVISFQESSSILRDLSLEEAKNNSYQYLTDLLDYVKEQFPQSSFYWHHTWSYQVGYDRNGFAMDSVEKQEQMAESNRAFALAACQDYDLLRIPSGDAWQYARKDSRVGDVLCNRGSKSDNYHDGDEGGGQYLNACVWFETLTGKSCIGNSFRPDNYSLSEDKIAGLQEAAHRAVAEMRG